MKRFLFYFLLISNFLFQFSTVQAINPIVIKKADFGAPPSNTKLTDDSIYFPNDVSLKCSGTYTISQTFQPKETTTIDPDTGEKTTTYEPYTVDKIEGNPPIFSKGFWTNPAALNFFVHIGNPIKTFFEDRTASKRAFTSYDPGSVYGSYGSATKGMSERVLKCLRGQRLVNAVRLANGEGGTVSNEQVAWDNGGQYDPVTDSTQNTGKKVQLDDIALSLAPNPYLSLTETSPDGKCVNGTDINYLFFDPAADCFTNVPELFPTPGPLSQFAPTSSNSFDPIPAGDACALYKTISPYGFGPSRRIVKTCSDDHGVEFDCETKNTNMPRGEGFSTSPYLATLIKQQKVEVIPEDLCKTYEKVTIKDKPNPVSFSIKAAIEAFGEVIDTAKTFIWPLTYTYTLAGEQTAGTSTDNTAFSSLISEKNKKDTCITEPDKPSSSTDDKSFDVGNNCIRQEFTLNILPQKEKL